MSWPEASKHRPLFIVNPASVMSPAGFAVSCHPWSHATAQTLLALLDQSPVCTTDSRQCGPGLLFYLCPERRAVRRQPIRPGGHRERVHCRCGGRPSARQEKACVHVADGLGPSGYWHALTATVSGRLYLGSPAAMAKPPPKSSSMRLVRGQFEGARHPRQLEQPHWRAPHPALHAARHRVCPCGNGRQPPRRDR